MKLIETDKLTLDDPVEKHLPAFREQRGPGDRHYAATIRQIMSHSSGITTSVPTRPRNFFSHAWLSRDMSEIHSAVAGTRLEYEPGQKVQYSNAAPYVLGQIIALRAGRPYHQFVQETILDPLEMNDTFYILPKKAADRMAVVYRNANGVQDTFFRFDPTWNMTMTMPDGGLFAPPADVAKFVQAFLDNNGDVLSTDTVHTMLSEQAPGWGLGWAIEGDGSFHHTGSAGTLAWGDPHTGIVGILFFQIQDPNTIDPLRAAFRNAVMDTFSVTEEDAN